MAEGLRKKAEYATRRPNGFWLSRKPLEVQRVSTIVDRFWDYEVHPILLKYRGENNHAKGINLMVVDFQGT